MPQNLPPKVTVLMPVKDTREDWLRIAIRGIAGQTHPNLDLRIGDDGSTRASTLAALRAARERWPERVFVHRRPESGGTARALDEAMAHADPDTVYFTKADSDDLFHREREANRVKLFGSLPPQIALLYDNYFMLRYLRLRGPEKEEITRPVMEPVLLRPYDYRALLHSNFIHGNSMWRASVYDRIPRSFVYDGYDGKPNRHGEDYALWLAITDYWDAYWFDQDPAFTWTYRFYRESKYNADKKGVDYARSLLQQRAKERRGLC